MTGRSVPEWVGSSPDAPIPPRVRLRVFERYAGVCQLTGRKIRAGDKWDLDHRIALANGGTHSEDNLQPVSREAHREKTRQDVALKSKAARVRAKHLGIAKPKSSLSHPTLKRTVTGQVVPR
jgi:5-methylcytosine-specific restriction protein A